MKIFRQSTQVLFLAVIYGVLPAAAAVIGLTPPASSVALGSTYEQPIFISGLVTGGAPSLSGYDLTISFGAGLLPTGFTFGDPVLGDQLDLSSYGTFTFASGSPGSYSVFELSFDSVATLNSQQAGAFQIGRLRFQTVQAGLFPVTLAVNYLSDANGDPLPYVIGVGSVNVNVVAPQSVPEPVSYATSGAGVVVFALVLFRKR